MKIEGQKWIKGRNEVIKKINKDFKEAKTLEEKTTVMVRASMAALGIAIMGAKEKLERRNE